MHIYCLPSPVSFTHINSFNPCNSPMSRYNYYSYFTDGRNRGTERLSNLPMVTQLESRSEEIIESSVE